MDLLFASSRVEKQCTDLREARRLFGGDDQLANKLFSRINALRQAVVLKDIIVQPQFRFHNLWKKGEKGNKDLKGYFAIDVKTRREPWRIVLRPLDETSEPFDPCNIDELAGSVEIVEIKEVSKHYE